MISVCIATCDNGVRNVEHLKILYRSILMQDCKDIIEVVVSDDSTNDEIGKYCKQEGIRYYQNSEPINMNNAISKARGEIIKPMLYGDYFTEPDTLSKFSKALENSFWGFCFSKYESGIHIPYPNEDIFDEHDKEVAEDHNTYGCLSAMGFIRTADVEFIMDSYFYVGMQIVYGVPTFVDTIVNVRNEKYANISREV